MKLEKEILETIKDIQDINKELSSQNHDAEKLRSINRKAKLNATYIPIDSMNIAQLISRLPFYKTLYLEELRKNTKECYEIILKEYEL